MEANPPAAVARMARITAGQPAPGASPSPIQMTMPSPIPVSTVKVIMEGAGCILVLLNGPAEAGGSPAGHVARGIGRNSHGSHQHSPFPLHSSRTAPPVIGAAPAASCRKDWPRHQSKLPARPTLAETALATFAKAKLDCPGGGLPCKVVSSHAEDRPSNMRQ